MTNFFTLILDTTSPTSVSILLDGGAQFATQQLINATINTSDLTTTGYQMKIWGDVDLLHDTNIQDTELKSSWITYLSTKQIKLLSGDGNKSISVRLRDDVYNESAIASSSILLDEDMPVVTVTNPDVSKISKINGKNIASFSFTSDSKFSEYKVKVVSSSGVSHDSGVQIPTTAGSVNMSGTGSFEANTPIDCQINGKDLEVASSGDGNKIIKVFVKDEAGNWSS